MNSRRCGIGHVLSINKDVVEDKRWLASCYCNLIDLGEAEMPLSQSQRLERYCSATVAHGKYHF